MEMKGSIPFNQTFQIRIDKEGVWHYNGAVMFRKEIVNFFYQHLRQDESGKYLIELENDRCYLEVEDTPFVVRAVHATLSEQETQKTFQLLLSDDTLDTLDPETLWIGQDDVLYCLVKDRRFKARFLRPAYYQLADDIEHDEVRDSFYIPMNGKSYYLENKVNR